jgi:lipase
LHVHHLGDPAGEPLVCLHGLSGHGRRFVRLAEALKTRHVIAPDLRGHGRSGKEPPWDIATHVGDLLESIEEPKADWLGFSFGGRLAAHIAAEHPDRVKTLTLLDAALHIPPDMAHRRADGARQEERYPSFTSAVDGQQDPDNPYESPREHREEEIRENFIEENGVYRARYSPAMAVVAFSEMARPAPPETAHPTLSVIGDRSWMTNAGRGDVVVVRAGHPVLWDAFDAVAAAVESHIE